jgi:UDP-3-O-[3-hydroxymyristoyl] glucosamine N-acyltransferase
MRLTVRQVADLVGGELRGDGDREIRGAATLESAGCADIAYACDERYLARLAESEAGAVIVPRAAVARSFPSAAALVFADHPQLAFARVLQALERAPLAAGIDAGAFVSESAEVHPTARVHPFAYVGDGARVGPRTVVHPHVYIGSEVTVGADTVLYPRVTLYPRSRIGDRVILHAGAVVGCDGYGFVWDGERHFKIAQLGVAVIEDDVEVGSGCTIDRAALGETRIGRGTKLDNLVHVGHNVRIGQHCLLVAQVGVAGSTQIGDHVVLGGQVGVGGHLRIADGVRVGGQGGVAKSLTRAGDYWGTPAREHQSWLRALASLSRVPDLWRKVQELTRRVDSLERSERG